MTAAGTRTPRVRGAALAVPLLLVPALLLVCTAPGAHAALLTVNRADGRTRGKRGSSRGGAGGRVGGRAGGREVSGWPAEKGTTG
jgi:hypothetical protein